MANIKDLYAKFLENFPRFEPMVRSYYPYGDHGLKIFTKQGKKFIFEIDKDGISLKKG